MSALVHDVRVQCGRCGTWYWADDPHECSVPGPTNTDVLDAAFPPHGRMLTGVADREARQARRDYRARIADEDAGRPARSVGVNRARLLDAGWWTWLTGLLGKEVP